MYNTAPSQFEIERSLLQKAVRRGNEELVEKVFNYLLNNGNKKWLQDRLAVMTYEECWTYGSVMLIEPNDYKLMGQYKTLARTVKNKNAAGLASLAIKFKDGDKSALLGDARQQKAIKSVANGITDPVGFWNFIRTEPGYNDNKQRVDAAEKAMNRAKFPGDKAMMLAAAYLSIKYPIPDTLTIEPNNDPDFPYFIAVDKHTTIGQELYGEACNKINLMPYSGMQIAFYLEGSVCNQITNSPFWDLDKEWQFKHMGYTLAGAEKIWEQLKQEFISMKRVDVEVKDMNTKINTVIKNDSDQGELF
jgi:hypothetical protein